MAYKENLLTNQCRVERHLAQDAVYHICKNGDILHLLTDCIFARHFWLRGFIDIAWNPSSVGWYKLNTDGIVKRNGLSPADSCYEEAGILSFNIHSERLTLLRIGWLLSPSPLSWGFIICSVLLMACSR
ncbi:conserved hypothetical protein [Ricinus communis]|uniref:Reverse transcriptase zinc-binding domain-containing protein n=1 Tax=Ricinus communis TaxID=3988 RepID=B9TBW5_RICCO|nr:conserved hypothetical protein [Ricinus communis]